MRAIAKGLLLPTLLFGALACTKTVRRETLPSDTMTRVREEPGSVRGFVLRDGTAIELGARSSVALEGDWLIVSRAGQRDVVLTDTLAVDDVTHVMLKQTDVAATIGAVVLLGGAIALIALALEDEPEPEPEPTSCPFIYAYDGNAFVSVAEPLGGAISAGLQRTDLSRLEGLAARDGSYHLIVGNEQPEIQHIDALSLVVVDHPHGTAVIADRAGTLHVAGPLVAPLRATGTAGEDLLPAVGTQDDEWWPGRSGSLFPAAQRRDTLTLAFPRTSADSARLVLHARTSLLGAHTLKTMLDMWGGEVDYWYGMLDGSAPVRAAHQEWVEREELWVVKVWVHERDGWVVQDVVVGGGPIVSELQAVTLDLSRVEGSTVEVRLHPARGFWDFDFIALDTTGPATPRMTELAITQAGSLAGQDARALLNAVDGRYLNMERTGERFDVQYSAPALVPGMARTVFARTTGYYKIETDRSGSRQAARLDSLWLQPGYAVQLAEQAYLEQRVRRAAR